MPNDKKPGSILTKLGQYEAENRDTKPLYDEWAGTYEADLLVNLGYTGHKIAADALVDFFSNQTAPIIDIGCGTGLVGQALAQHGYAAIDGIDISPDMPAHAKAKAVYGKLLTGDLNGRTVIGDASYEAAICAGSFAPGHLGPQSHTEFIRIVKPGGPIVIFMNGVHFENDGYEAHIRALQEQGLWQVVSITSHNYMSALHRPGKLVITRKT